MWRKLPHLNFRVAAGADFSDDGEAISFKQRGCDVWIGGVVFCRFRDFAGTDAGRVNLSCIFLWENFFSFLSQNFLIATFFLVFWRGENLRIAARVVVILNLKLFQTRIILAPLKKLLMLRKLFL
jgi:hypothetical protein